jgi:hypothetical protein
MVSMKIQRLFSALPGDNFSIAVELYILIIHRVAESQKKQKKTICKENKS